MEYKLLLLLIGTSAIAAHELIVDSDPVEDGPNVNCWYSSVNGYLPKQRCLLKVIVNKTECRARIVEYYGSPFAIKKLHQKAIIIASSPYRVNPTNDINLFDIECYGNECTLDRDLIKEIWETVGPYRNKSGECFDRMADDIVSAVQEEAERARNIFGTYPSSTTQVPTEPTISWEEATTNPGYVPVKDSASVPSVMQPLVDSTAPSPSGEPGTTNPGLSATPRSTTRRQPRITKPGPSSTPRSTTRRQPRTTRPLPSATPSGSPSGEPSSTEPLPSVTPGGASTEQPEYTYSSPSVTPGGASTEQPEYTYPSPSVTPGGASTEQPEYTYPSPTDTPSTDPSEEPRTTDPLPSETPSFPQPTTPPSPPSNDCEECVKLFTAILQKLEIVPLCASHDTDCLKRSLEKVNRLIEEVAEYLITGGNPCDIERYRIIQKELEAWKLSLQRQVDPQLLKLREYKEKLEQIERILSDSSAAEEYLIIQARGEIQKALRIIGDEGIPNRATPRFVYEDIASQITTEW